ARPFATVHAVHDNRVPFTNLPTRSVSEDPRSRLQHRRHLMGETRVNLRHLLEDIRDTYPFPVEEVILTELVANALDSGASEIRLTIATEPPALTVCDNGKGMSPPQLDRYHDIAATTKERGTGIGFAGLGAKLALLAAEAVITETRAAQSTNATRWRLEGNSRAPWELIEPAARIAGLSGTAVTLELREACP